MKEVVLVDSQAARVRRFREAVALYREVFRPMRERTQEARERARAQLDRARQSYEALRVSQRAYRLRRSAGSEEIRLHVFPTADEALKFLRREPPYAWAPRPAVVFTDLYLSGSEGPSFVERVKADAGLRGLPTVMLCAGASARDVRSAWEAGSNAVVDLPLDGDGGLERVTDVLRFWLTEAEIPH